MVEVKEEKKNWTTEVNNPGFHLCMKCGKPLPPNEDGSQKFRRQPEPCFECVWKNK